MALAGHFLHATDDHVVLVKEVTDSGTQPGYEWDRHRDQITRLYTSVEPRRTLKDVQAVMKNVHGFNQS
jgi:hypothetical protein